MTVSGHPAAARSTPSAAGAAVVSEDESLPPHAASVSDAAIATPSSGLIFMSGGSPDVVWW
jgi:hypothetical protein